MNRTAYHRAYYQANADRRRRQRLDSHRRTRTDKAMRYARELGIVGHTSYGDVAR